MNGNGFNDYVEWYSNVNNFTVYNIKSAIGSPVVIDEVLEILNLPVTPFENIEWRNTITIRNNNTIPIEVVHKVSPPINAFSLTLDGIVKTLSYPTVEAIDPYLTIIDKDDPLHDISVYLSPWENATFVLEYQTDPVTISLTREFPDYVYVSDNAHIILTLKLKNWVDDNVSEIEHALLIDYGTDLSMCEGDFELGCSENLTISEEEVVNGKYSFEVDVLEANEVATYTVDYYTPTVKVIETNTGKRGINGTMHSFKQIKFKSIGSETLSDVRYRETGIDCTTIYRIVDSIGRDLKYKCSVLKIYLGLFNPAETKEIWIWTRTTEEELEEEGYAPGIMDWFKNFIERFNKGKVLYNLTEDSWLYGWFGEQILVGELMVILVVFVLVLGAIVGIVMLGKYVDRNKIASELDKKFGR